MITLQTLLGSLADLLAKQLLPLAFAIGVLMFFYGLFRYVYNLGSKEVKSEARFILTWGIVVMFIMTALWGIIVFLQGEFGVGGDNNLAPITDVDPFN